MSMNTGDRNGGDPIELLRAGAQIYRRPKKTRACPSEDELRLLLPGQLPPKRAGQLLEHAAQCDWCGTMLREATQDVLTPPTSEEESLAAKSRWADPASRRELAERIARRPSTWRPILFRWVPAGALAMAGLAFVAIFPGWSHNPSHTEKLLAEAYTKYRQTPMRLPDAAWGKQRIQMGGESSRFAEPAELADAEANIIRGLNAKSEDPEWLRLQGEHEWISGNAAAAIDTLEHAKDLRPSDPAILADLGLAYFAKAKPGDDESYRKAFDSLCAAQRRKPQDLALLFDKALAAEYIQAPSVATEAWNEYLSRDSNSAWATEARAHLAAVKKNSNASKTTPAEAPRER